LTAAEHNTKQRLGEHTTIQRVYRCNRGLNSQVCRFRYDVHSLSHMYSGDATGNYFDRHGGVWTRTP